MSDRIWHNKTPDEFHPAFYVLLLNNIRIGHVIVSYIHITASIKKYDSPLHSGDRIALKHERTGALGAKHGPLYHAEDISGYPYIAMYRSPAVNNTITWIYTYHRSRGIVKLIVVATFNKGIA